MPENSKKLSLTDARAGPRQHGRQAAYHRQRLRDPEEKAPGQEHGKWPRPNEERESDDDDHRARHEGRRESASDQEARRHGGDHAREADSGSHEPQLPVRQRLSAADLRQERTEGAQAEGVAEEEQAEETGPVEPEQSGLAPHLKERSLHHG